MTVLNAAFPADFVEWFPGEDFADGGLVINTFTNALADTNGNENGNWSLGHVPTSAEQAVITADAQGYTVSLTSVTLGALKIDDNSGSGDSLGGGGSYGSFSDPPTILGLFELDNMVDGGDGIDVITRGDVTATNCAGGNVCFLGWGSAKTFTINGGRIQFTGSTAPIPANATIVSLGGGVAQGITVLPGNAYATLTQSSGKAGDTISGTYDNSWGFAPNGGKCGSVALTNFTASAGSWSGKIATGTPGGSQTVNLTNSTNAQTIGAGTIAVAGLSNSRLSLDLSLGL